MQEGKLIGFKIPIRMHIELKARLFYDEIPMTRFVRSYIEAYLNNDPLVLEFVDQHKRKNNSICNYCYSVNMLKTFRRSCVKSFQHNSDLLSDKVIHPDGLPIINSAFFRFSGHGELVITA